MKKNLRKILILVFFLFATFTFAQEKISLTITPPLIKVTLNPGQSWSSSIKIVNNNPTDLNVFVTIMDFKSGPEGGIIFIKDKTKEDKRFLLSQWVDLPKEPISIPAFQSKNIPFTIKVPENAEPGGKYAAILVGTKPPEEVSGTAIKITPLVSSLILANIRGETREEILIREFSTDKVFYQKPSVKFNLKIENIGNVHVQPQGEIKILNMFGKERGSIPFNQKTEYGNILPKSSRKWTFTWEREESLFETGKYKAILTLIYGSEAKQTINQEIYFWIIPVVPIFAILGGIFLLFGFFFLMVKIYVKRMVSATISLAKKEALIGSEKMKIFVPMSTKRIMDIKRVSPKIESEILEKLSKEEKISKIKSFLLKRKFLLPIILVILILIFGLIIFSKEGLKEDKNYQISKKEEGEILPSQIVEEAKKEPEILEREIKEEKIEIDKKSFSIVVLNGSGIKGLASEVAKNLEREGFQIAKIGNADRFDYPETLIKYKKEKEKEAKFLNQFFREKFKLVEEKDQKEDIVLIIGRDFK